MNLGIVRGKVVNHKLIPELTDTHFLIVDTLTREDLRSKKGAATGRQVVVATHLNPAVGQTVGYVEGREGTNAYYPRNVAVDIYCGLIVEQIDYRPIDGPKTN